jgi:hypothetical protein
VTWECFSVQVPYANERLGSSLSLWCQICQMLQRRWSATHWVQVKGSRTFDGWMASFSWKKWEHNAWHELLSTSKWIHRSIEASLSLGWSCHILSSIGSPHSNYFKLCSSSKALRSAESASLRGFVQQGCATKEKYRSRMMTLLVLL